MNDDFLWRLSEALATWLAAIGTVAAVIVALYLARRDAMIQLRVKAGIRQVFLEGGGQMSGGRWVSVSATNVGRRAATVHGFSWKFGWFSRIHHYQLPDRNPWTDTLPKKIDDGQSATLMIPLELFRANFAAAARDRLRWPLMRLRAGRLYVIAHTSSGDNFRTLVEKDLRREVLRLAKSRHGEV